MLEARRRERQIHADLEIAVTESNGKIAGHAVPVRTDAAVPEQGLSSGLVFLIGRIDGVSSVQELAWMNGMQIEKLSEDLAKLRAHGLIDVEGGEESVNSRITTQSDVIDLSKIQDVEASLGDDADEGPANGRTTTREVSVHEQREQARMLEENFAEEERSRQFPAQQPLPIPRGWPTPFEEFQLPERWESLAGKVDVRALRLAAYYVEHLGTVNHYELLQMDAGSKQREIVAAAQNLRAFFAPERWEEFESRELVGAVRRVFNAAGNAEQILANEENRAGYDTALAFLEADE